ncbi:MAG TPA: GDSL-type esterase/lipase family protein [Ktedonobacterales bacterium]|nr:GDSL-type esterase/lipase family protein [Ktedonobacterales bacterium]
MRLLHARHWRQASHQKSVRGFTHGSPRRWTLAVILTLATLLAAVLAFSQPSSVHANGVGSSHSEKDYLALGDSVPFGYNPLVANPADTDQFIGYPTSVAQTLGLRLTNAACPGATSSYLVSLAGPDWACIPFRSRFPLHVNYSTSQLDFAVAFLRSHPHTRLVTLTIGANDLFRLQSLCGGSISCVQAGLPGLLATLAANLNTTYAAIRHTAHYHGQLVALTYYSTNYADPTTTAIIHALDETLGQRTRAWGGVVASGFAAFAAASASANGDPCAAGLLIRLSATICDVHPSVAGRILLAHTVVAMVRHNDARSVAG